MAIGHPARFDDFLGRYSSNPPLIDLRVIAIAFYIDGGFDRRTASADLLELVIVVSLTKIPDLAEPQHGFRLKRARKLHRLPVRPSGLPLVLMGISAPPTPPVAATTLTSAGQQDGATAAWVIVM